MFPKKIKPIKAYFTLDNLPFFPVIFAGKFIGGLLSPRYTDVSGILSKGQREEVEKRRTNSSENLSHPLMEVGEVSGWFSGEKVWGENAVLIFP